MIRTFTKLLVIRIVANVRSLSLRNISIFLSFELFSVSSDAISVGVRLKKAISEPLAKPDNNSNTTVNTAVNNIPTDGD